MPKGVYERSGPPVTREINIENWVRHGYEYGGCRRTVADIEAMEAKRGVRYDGSGADFVSEADWPSEPIGPCCDRPCCRVTA